MPRWYQEGFFISGKQSFAYLDMSPAQHKLPRGRIAHGNAIFNTTPARAFVQTDLYSTFFGTSINDEIERRLFGDVDRRGSAAVRAFAGNDVGKWHSHFEAFFEYIDIQKVRTPKGLDWLRAQYPALTQNELMLEMQGIRMMHCTIWAEGVREIVSAEQSDVKFIISDNPVTVYNYAMRPDHKSCAYPHDPSILLKASQTVFVLNQDFCLILSNLEYARDPSVNPREKRTFARNFRRSMVRTDAFIKIRQLSNAEVIQINHILKSRARRFIAAGRREWLYPEKAVESSWADLRYVLFPPKNDLIHFGGELFAKFDDGSIHYQDEFGQTEKKPDYLKKTEKYTKVRAGDFCGCGSGLSFGHCCSSIASALRPSWSERSIRERNLMFCNAITNVLELDGKRDWITVRQELTDSKISEIYSLFAGLWPLETDMLALLPKPDGVPRAVYTGIIHPEKIIEVALGISAYFGQTLIQHPFIHPRTMKSEFSPIENPHMYRNEFLKSVIFFLTVLPLVDSGEINLAPDLCHFDNHLQQQMFAMARRRAKSALKGPRKAKSAAELQATQDTQRSLLSLPKTNILALLRRSFPGFSQEELEKTFADIERAKADDPLAVLQNDVRYSSKSGQMNLMTLAPNFEMAFIWHRRRDRV